MRGQQTLMKDKENWLLWNFELYIEEFFQSVLGADFVICYESFKQRLVMGYNVINFSAKGWLGSKLKFLQLVCRKKYKDQQREMVLIIYISASKLQTGCLL